MLSFYTKTYCVNSMIFALAEAKRGNLVTVTKHLLDVYQAITVIDPTCVTDWGSPAREAVSLIRDAIEACVETYFGGTLVSKIQDVSNCRWFMDARHEMSMKDV